MSELNLWENPLISIEDRLKIAVQQITELQRQIADLECCANCKFDLTEDCLKKNEFTVGNKVCPEWQPDGKTRKERRDERK